MKKSLIALALVSLSTASMADVILYGQIKGGVETTFANKVGKAKVKGTTTQIVDYGSRIGFKGHEDLNDSLQAIWQVESRVDIGGGKDDKGNPRGFGSRDSFIGLKGGFGTVKVSYQQTPVKELNGKLDQWEYASDFAGLGNFVRGNDAVRRATAISYETPDMGGFSAKGYFSPNEQYNGEKATAPFSNHKGPRGGIYGVSASYNNSGFFGDIAGVAVKNGGNNKSTSDTGYQALAQVGYQNDQWLAGVAYQRSQHVDEGALDKLNEVAASVAYTLNDALTLKGSAAYGFGAKDVAGNKLAGNGKYYQGLVGADYALSKRTTVNGQYGYFQQGNKANKLKANTVSVGLKHKF